MEENLKVETGAFLIKLTNGKIHQLILDKKMIDELINSLPSLYKDGVIQISKEPIESITFDIHES